MTGKAPLGIAWRPFHATRVFNAVNNLANATPLSSLGLTSWDSWSTISASLDNAEASKMYLVTGLPHFLHLLGLHWFDYNSINEYGPFLDYLLVSLIAALTAEYIRELLLRNCTYQISPKLLEWFWPVSAFALFLTSPLTYRMMLAPWHEVPWLAFFTISFLMAIKGKPVLSLLSLFLAGLFHWMWSFILAVFYAGTIIASKYTEQKSNSKSLLPGYAFSKVNPRDLFLSLLVPTLLFRLQLFFLETFFSITHQGASALARIGIDSASNVHHGGLLATLQFLGGNRLSLCLENGALTGLNANIFKFNCLLSISGFALISSAALIFYLLACCREKTLRWALVPIVWILFAFLAVFQQSNAVHIHGHSFIFVQIYTYGIIYLLSTASHVFQLTNRATLLVALPIMIGIIINSIRVSFTTGVFG